MLASLFLPDIKHSINLYLDKIVFEESDHWVIVEALELHNFVRMHKLKEIDLEEIIKVLEWNIKILK